MVAGDFNAISDVSEKLDGRPPNLVSLEEFNTMINDCGIIDCGYEGSKYTWSNNQEGGALFGRGLTEFSLIRRGLMFSPLLCYGERLTTLNIKTFSYAYSD